MLFCALGLFIFFQTGTDQPISAPPGNDATHIVTLAIAPFERTSEEIPGLEYEIERRLSASAPTPMNKIAGSMAVAYQA